MNKALLIIFLLFFQNSSNNNSELEPRYLSLKIPYKYYLMSGNYCILKFEKDETSESELNAFLKSIVLKNKKEKFMTILHNNTGVKNNISSVELLLFKTDFYIKFVPGDTLSIYFTIFKPIKFTPEKMKEYTIKLKVDDREVEGFFQDWDIEFGRKKTSKIIKKLIL